MLGSRQAPNPREAMIAAVKINWRLWTIFQSELSAPESTVELTMRQNMLSLANFVDKKTMEFLKSPSAELLESLAKINLTLCGDFTPDASDLPAEPMPAVSLA